MQFEKLEEEMNMEEVLKSKAVQGGIVAVRQYFGYGLVSIMVAPILTLVAVVVAIPLGKIGRRFFGLRTASASTWDKMMIAKLLVAFALALLQGLYLFKVAVQAKADYSTLESPEDVGLAVLFTCSWSATWLFVANVALFTAFDLVL